MNFSCFLVIWFFLALEVQEQTVNWLVLHYPSGSGHDSGEPTFSLKEMILQFYIWSYYGDGDGDSP